MPTRLPRYLYVLFGISIAVLVISLLVAELYVPDVGPSESLIPGFGSSGETAQTASRPAGADSTAVDAATVSRSASGGSSGSAWLIGAALGVAVLSLLVTGASVWTVSSASTGDAPAASGPSETALGAADRLSGVLVDTVLSGRRWGQLAYMKFQLGDEAPEDFPERVARAKAATTDHREALMSTLMRSAPFLPNDVLDAAHEVDRLVEQMLADDSVPARYGNELATGLTASYYTFSKKVRAWTGAETLDVERLLGGDSDEDAPDETDSPEDANA